MQLKPASEYNLDAMEIGELTEFIKTIGQNAKMISSARRLFPDRPKGYMSATMQLRSYAKHKLAAMELRVTGSIAKAQEHETLCDSIYAKLPDYAKGW